MLLGIAIYHKVITFSYYKRHLVVKYSYFETKVILIFQAKAMFREIDQGNDLTFMRLRTKKHEIMVAPDRDYLLLVVQNTHDN